MKKNNHWFTSLAKRILQPDSSALWIFVLLAATALATYFVYCEWGWLRENGIKGDALESHSTTIRNIAFPFGGLLGILLAIWRSLVAKRQADAAREHANAAIAQSQIAITQTEIAQEGLRNERYQKGADMLGSRSMATRIGGIHALDKLAQEYPDEYHILIMKLLCAFIRHCPDVNPKGEAPREIQEALDVIAYRSEGQLNLEGAGRILDFQGAYLKGITLGSGANLAKANMSGADLSNTRLYGIDLTGAIMIGTNLSGAELHDVRLTKASLSDATLTSTRFTRVLGLTQKQLDAAKASKDEPPTIVETFDDETGKELVWNR